MQFTRPAMAAVRLMGTCFRSGVKVVLGCNGVIWIGSAGRLFGTEQWSSHQARAVAGVLLAIQNMAVAGRLVTLTAIRHCFKSP